MLLLALLAASAAPHPTELKLFKDWTVGCDNGLACHAVALIPDDGEDGSATMSMERGAGADAMAEVHFTLDSDGARSVAADGRKLPVRLVAENGGAKVNPADLQALLPALRSAARLELLDAKGAPLARVSLAGASAALLFIDDRQGRVGTVTALVRPGPKPAATLPPPPPLPVVVAAPEAKGRPLALSPSRVKALRKERQCEIKEVGGPDSVETYRLDARRTLILLSCGSGAYNVSSMPLIAEGDARNLSIVPAPFDVKEDWWQNGPPILVNADWNGKAAMLSSYSKGRGLGDCGVSQEFVWDGERFRLVEQSEMGECRGSTDFITTWRARVVNR